MLWVAPSVAPSLAGVRIFAALAQAAELVLTSLIARELGGGRAAQAVAALAVATGPVSLRSPHTSRNPEAARGV